MPSSDAERWNERYRESRNLTFERPRPFLVENAGLLPRQGLAIDLAMGLGGNAGFLIGRGLRVVGVDISTVAASLVKRRRPEVMALVADLTRFYLPPGRFDLIINFYYLQRDLWPAIEAALRPGGVLVSKRSLRYSEYPPSLTRIISCSQVAASGLPIWRPWSITKDAGRRTTKERISSLIAQKPIEEI
jgi:hypothetical protein